MRRLAVAALTLLVLAGCAAKKEAPVQAMKLGGDFTLTDQNGKPFALHELRGKNALLFFGFTHCPDACPTMLSKLARVYKIIGKEQAEKITTVFVSIDPDRDTPPVLKEYLSYFAIPTVGLTGKKSEIDQVVKQYEAKYSITPSQSAAGPSVSHTTWLYVIDDEGRTRNRFHHGSTAEEIAAYVRTLGS